MPHIALTASFTMVGTVVSRMLIDMEVDAGFHSLQQTSR